jgi:uncharacterized RDD family membrane protein YckC
LLFRGLTHQVIKLDPQASVSARITASSLDGFILAVMIYFVSLITDFTTATESTHSFEDYWRLWLVTSPEWWALHLAWWLGSLAHRVDGNDTLAGTYLVLSFLYHVLFEFTAFRATPGKLIMGLSVVNARGERISLFRAVARFISELLQIPISALVLSGLLRPTQFRFDRPASDAWSGSYVIKRKNSATFAAENPQGCFCTQKLDLEVIHRLRMRLVWVCAAATLAMLIASVSGAWIWLAPCVVAWLPFVVSLQLRENKLRRDQSQENPPDQ